MERLWGAPARVTPAHPKAITTATAPLGRWRRGINELLILAATPLSLSSVISDFSKDFRNQRRSMELGSWRSRPEPGVEEAKLGNSWRKGDSFFIMESEALWISMA